MTQQSGNLTTRRPLDHRSRARNRRSWALCAGPPPHRRKPDAGPSYAVAADRMQDVLRPNKQLWLKAWLSAFQELTRRASGSAAIRASSNCVFLVAAYDCQAQGAVRPTLVSIAVPDAERLPAHRRTAW